MANNQKDKSNIQKVKEAYEKEKGNTIGFDSKKALQNAMQLIDPTKQESRTYSTFNKTTLRTYMRNIATNSKNLRNLSRFLYYRSQPYRRLIWYNATMILPEARLIIPDYNPVKNTDSNKMLKQYYDTAEILDSMNLSLELLKAYIIAWRDDVFYGCTYYEPDEGFFILPLDPDYCRISSTYYTGDLGFSMDMSYFSRREEQLEYYGEPFKSMWDEYQKDTVGQRWQPMPDDRAICFKINIDDLTLPIPPYIALFNSIINLCDLEELQSASDAMQVYKLLVAKLETLNNTQNPDDFKVDPDTALEYWNKLSAALPDYIAAALSPLPIDVINFGEDKATDTNKISKATSTFFNTAGGAQTLNSNTISGTTAWTGAIISDAEYAISSLLPQTQQWLNRFLKYQMKNPAKVKFLEVTAFTKETYRKHLVENATYGLPTKMAINTLEGFSELDTLSLNMLEETCFGLGDKLVPLHSTHTESSKSNGGAPSKDDVDLTDDGEASRDKRDQAG